MNNRTRLNALLLLIACLSSLPAAESESGLRLGAPFRDNAVLQRQMPIPVWGWSKPEAQITVQFADQKKTTIAGKDGKWTLQLSQLEASFEPRQMVVSDNANHKQTIQNILVGEVWLASGQSNMQWKVQKSTCNQLQVEPRGEVVPIREFEVTSVVAMLHPIEKADGEWKNGNYGDYSAIAFAFAHRLYEELQVPIGILNCSFSQTAIQAWVPREGFRDAKDEYSQAIYRKIQETNPGSTEHQAAWNKFYAEIEQTLSENAKRVKAGEAPRAISTKTPGNMQGNRDASWLYNGRLHPVVPYAIRGGIWNQGYANMGEGLVYYNNLHNLVRGWRMVWDRPHLPVYFHQFYSNGRRPDSPNDPDIGRTAEMRLGTWLARDIPNTGMASQIDITGGIHYTSKAVPGQRLARHALKNQYGKKVVADGPMFKSYRVTGNKLIVEFDHADGGLVVANAGYNIDRSNEDRTGFADPHVIDDGEEQVKLFYLADKSGKWYPAQMQIDGEQVILTSAQVPSPCGVSYGTGGIGFQPNLYNRALLPMTPFIYFDHQLVTSETWPDEKLKVAGAEIDPATVGKLYEWRKMPLLSTQFRDNAVLQAGVPITIWGSALHDYGYEAAGEAVIKFSFAGIEKTIPVKSGSPGIVEFGPGNSRFSQCKEWRVTVPAMKASAEPKTLRVSFLIDGEVAHERVCHNIVIGDVWFVAASPETLKVSSTTESNGLVRMMRRKAKRFTSPSPSRYTVCVSRTPGNRFASEWTDATGFAAALGNRIASKTGQPVGILFMQSGMTSFGKGVPAKNTTLIKNWIPADDLKLAPSLQSDYEDLATVRPGNSFYADNARGYVSNWKQYWNDTIPRMMKTKSTPDEAAWGSYPTLASGVTSNAGEAYNVLAHSFTPASLKGIIFLTSPAMVEQDGGAHFGEQVSALANSWKARFGGDDPLFVYTLPNKRLAEKITVPENIQGNSRAIEIGDWSETEELMNSVAGD